MNKITSGRIQKKLPFDRLGDDAALEIFGSWYVEGGTTGFDYAP
ncbi:MAG: hypothetical protein QXI19_12935 [Candidatus Caldarchaeum sp.]